MSIEVRTDDGCRLRVVVEGADGAPPLLLANALGTTAAMWELQVGALVERFRLVRFDARGHGGSDVPPGPYAVERLGRDALAVLDHLGIARARFCGLSLGGMVGQWLGAEAPERVERLVLASTTAHAGAREIWDQRIAQVRAEGVGVLVDGIIERWLTPGFCDARPEVVERIAAMVGATPAEGYAAAAAAVRDHDMRDDLARITAPTLVIAGTRDPGTPPEQARFLADHIPDARLDELDAAHLANVEAADRFTALVLGFLAP